MKKVAIVGVEGSGKTVMLAGLGDLYSHPDEKGCFLAPKNFSTASYVADKIARMRKGEWPTATAGDEMQGLDWTLKRSKPDTRQRPDVVCEVSFLDFAGEVYRTAFGIGSGDPSLAEQAEALKRYVRDADELIVLVNLRDVITRGIDEPRVREAMWITKAILDAALIEDVGHKMPRAAIVLSQADSYADTIDACGGPLGVLKKYLPHVANDYSWLDVFAANAVDKTTLDDEGNVIPANGFTLRGLLPIMSWIRSGAAYKAGDVKTIVLPGGAQLRLRWCPPGTFTMGSPATEIGHSGNEVQHFVTLTKGFWLGETQVTQEQWTSVMKMNPSENKETVTTKTSFLGLRSDVEVVPHPQHPVECVSWDDCQRFIDTVNRSLSCNLRLPTEAEWEYACRAGTGGCYAGTGNLDEMGWHAGNSLSQTHPVGQKCPNAWGFFDMHGNVWEWCADWYGVWPGNGPVTDPKGPVMGDKRILRGGSWGDKSVLHCRSAFRFKNFPQYVSKYNGFRLCCFDEQDE